MLLWCRIVTARPAWRRAVRPLDNSPDCPPLDIAEMLATAVIEVGGGVAANSLPLTTSREGTEGNDLVIDATAVPDGLTLKIWLPFTNSVNVQTAEDDAVMPPSVTIQSIEGPVK